MVTGVEQWPLPIYATLPVPCDGVACLNVKSAGDLLERRVEPSAPAHCVDGLEAAGRHEPRPRIGGGGPTPAPPLLRRERHRAGLLRRGRSGRPGGAGWR